MARRGVVAFSFGGFFATAAAAAAAAAAASAANQAGQGACSGCEAQRTGAGGPSIAIQNSCPFEVRAIMGGPPWVEQNIPAGGQATMAPFACTGGAKCRVYFPPSTWTTAPSQDGMGDVERLGMFEFTLNGSLSTDISYIPGIAIPMTAQCSGGPIYGCTDGGYGGWTSFQDRLQAYCPGRLVPFQPQPPNSSIVVCEAGLYGGVDAMPFGRKWNMPGTISKAGVSMDSDDPQNVSTCQPWSEADECAQLNRGVHGCLGEEVCDGEKLFYQDYDMTKRDMPGKWNFSGYAAFVHTACGVFGGFAFGSDDRGRAAGSMKYGSNVADCQGVQVELCPAASTAYTPTTGFTYPPDAGNRR